MGLSDSREVSLWVLFFNGKFFYFWFSVLFKQKTLQSELVEVLDPNKLSTDGTIVLHSTAFSADGNFLAYGLSERGSDWIKIKIRDVRTGEDFPDVLTKVKFSLMSWTHDNKGLFYSVSASFVYDSWNSWSQMFVVNIGLLGTRWQDGRYRDYGEQESEGILSSCWRIARHRCARRWLSRVSMASKVSFVRNWRRNGEQIKNRNFFYFSRCRHATVSSCGNYLILKIVKDCRGHLWLFADLKKIGEIRGKLPLVPITENFEADYDVSWSWYRFHFSSE